MSELSVITIIRNREKHLHRLIDGLASSTILPRELIVVDMSDVPVELPRLAFPIHRVDFRTGGLPLAAARNAGARAAVGNNLLFLDVDCIPRQSLVAVMDRELNEADALVCAEVRYLGPDACHVANEVDLERAAISHSVRTFPKTGKRLETNAGLFWSLTFGIRQARFVDLGGFDDGYDGYGAEDTDFGFRAQAAGLPLVFLSGTGSFHQYHGVISPPLQHLSDIVRNANRFYARWGIWPMDGWLQAFAAIGVVAFGNGELRQLRAPTAAEIEAATQSPSVYF